MRTPEALETTFLCSLTDEELDHVSLGLGHSFGCVISGEPGAAVMYLRDEYNAIAIDAMTLTVSDVWRSAEALSS